MELELVIWDWGCGVGDRRLALSVLLSLCFFVSSCLGGEEYYRRGRETGRVG